MTQMFLVQVFLKFFADFPDFSQVFLGNVVNGLLIVKKRTQREGGTNSNPEPKPESFS